jgi:hypothetical protein
LASLVAGFFAPSFPLFPSLSFSLFFLLTLLLGLLLVLALRFAAKSVGSGDWVARLIDRKIQGKERFLTLVTLPDSQTSSPLHPLLEQDAVQRARTLVPAHDVPFVLDKRKFMASLLGSVLLLTLAFFAPVSLPPSLWSQLPGEEATEAFVATAEKLEQTASLLRQQHREEMAEQLLRLAQDLRSPELSPQEKLQRFAQVRKQLSPELAGKPHEPGWQIKLPDLPLPNLLPLDLRLFSKGQEKEGVEQGEKPQDQGQSQADKGEGTGEQNQKLASAAGKAQQAEDGKEKGQQQKPAFQQQGGGIQFDFPQKEEGQKKPDRGPQKPGEGPANTQVQAQGGRGPGQDPNRPGEGPNQGQFIDSQLSEAPDSRLVPQPGGIGGGIGGNPGERYYRPGEGPAGFLTKDARFVKVRVPRGFAPQAESGRRVPNTQKTAPVIPYSNAPLPPAGLPGQAQLKQPIPLEYRAILQK